MEYTITQKEGNRMRDHVRRNMPLFPMGIVTKLTELTPRQIRYYEQQGLISPARTKGNQRLFSFRDVDRLLQIKDLLEKGLNIAGVKEVLNQAKQNVEKKVDDSKKKISEKELRRLLKQQLIAPQQQGHTHLVQGHLIQGELRRFFHH